jgi:hypothetical protein
MSDNYQITYLCDISDSALSHCQKKVLGGTSKTTRSAEEVCASPDVVVVLIANSDAFHVLHSITALRYNKIVFVEKPMALRKSKLSAMFSKSCSRRWVFLDSAIALLNNPASFFNASIASEMPLDVELRNLDQFLPLNTVRIHPPLFLLFVFSWGDMLAGLPSLIFCFLTHMLELLWQRKSSKWQMYQLV